MAIFEAFAVSLVSGTAPKIFSEASKLVNSAKEHLGIGSVPDNSEQESLPAHSESERIDTLQNRVDALDSKMLEHAELVSLLAKQAQEHETALYELAKRVRLLFGTVIVLAIVLIVALAIV